MTRDEIYDHLAQVYLGKRKQADKKEKQQFNAWLVINIFITVIIFSSAFYGLTAFLKQRSTFLQSKVTFPLHNGRILLEYNFKEDVSPIKSFDLIVPEMDAVKYNTLQFSIRAREEGTPGIVKVIVNNQRNEEASYYIQGVDLEWKEVKIPLGEFEQITDWQNLNEVSFVLESWNVDKKKGIVLIDDVRFSGTSDAT